VKSDKQIDDQVDAAPNDAEPNAKFAPPGLWATFARNSLHDVTCGWDERVCAMGQSALTELSQLADLITGRKSWRLSIEEARRVNRDALASARQSREAGNRAHPVAAVAGGLVPQFALGVITGGLSATPLAQGAMAASISLAESPEDLTTIEGLKIAVPRAGIAGGSAAALAKGGQIARRALTPIAKYFSAKSFGRVLAQVRQIAPCEVARKLLNLSRFPRLISRNAKLRRCG
jgi:hypothetical protein